MNFMLPCTVLTMLLNAVFFFLFLQHLGFPWVPKRSFKSTVENFYLRTVFLLGFWMFFFSSILNNILLSLITLYIRFNYGKVCQSSLSLSLISLTLLANAGEIQRNMWTIGEIVFTMIFIFLSTHKKKEIDQISP